MILPNAAELLELTHKEMENLFLFHGSPQKSSDFLGWGRRGGARDQGGVLLEEELRPNHFFDRKRIQNHLGD